MAGTVICPPLTPLAVPADARVMERDLLPWKAELEEMALVTEEFTAVHKVPFSKLLSFRVLPTVFWSLEDSRSWLLFAEED